VGICAQSTFSIVRSFKQQSALFLNPWILLNVSKRMARTDSPIHTYIHTYIHTHTHTHTHEGVFKSFRTGRLEQELQTVKLSATRCSCIAVLWVSVVGFAALTLCVASQRVFIAVSVYIVIGSVWKLLDTPSYTHTHTAHSDSLFQSESRYR
jgi:hypothetical protein